MKGYLNHLGKNWRVGGHALRDVCAHFIHGFIPIIKIRHHQPTKKIRRILRHEPYKNGGERT